MRCNADLSSFESTERDLERLSTDVDESVVLNQSEQYLPCRRKATMQADDGPNLNPWVAAIWKGQKIPRLLQSRNELS